MILHGALTGIIDLATADLQDARWWKRTRLTSTWIAKQQLAKTCELRLQHHFAVLDYESDRQQLEHHWEASNKIIAQLDELHRPWIDAKAAYQDTYKKLYDSYVNTFGAPGDPEHDARVEATVTYWRETRK